MDGFNTEVKEYRKKPVVITAYRTNEEMEIKTLEGTMKASVGDYIVTGVQGETYPVKPDIFNETYEEVTEEKTIDEYYSEWFELVEELSDKEIDLINLKETYNQKEFEIVYLDKTIDWKGLYGSAAEKVRKQHTTKELQALVDAKNDLQISIDYLKRRIEYIKSLTNMQMALIDAGVIE